MIDLWNMVQAARWLGVAPWELLERPEWYQVALDLKPIDEEMNRRAIKRAAAR